LKNKDKFSKFSVSYKVILVFKYLLNTYNSITIAFKLINYKAYNTPKEYLAIKC
ncbi:hypothetical protein BU23DRAFT_467160, partial [Bimuria novae-zelandiae CBS 107.79]